MYKKKVVMNNALNTEVMCLPNEFLILYLILFFIFIYYLRLNTKKINISGAYSGVTFGFILFYILIPILIIILQDQFSSSIKYKAIEQFVLKRDYKDHLLALIVILVGFIAFHFGYKFSFKYRVRLKDSKVNKNVELNGRINNNNFLKIFEVIGYTTLIIGGISFFIIISSLGGIVNTLAIGEQFRGFGDTALSDFVGVNTALFFIPSRLITVAPIIFYFLIINRRNVIDKIMFTFSIPFAILFFLFNAGRGPLIIYLLAFIYIFMKKYFKKVWLKLFLIGVFSLPLLDVLDRLFIYLSTSKWYKVEEANYLSYIFQFSHPVKTILNLNDIVNVENYFFGTSIFRDVLSILPKINFDPLFYNVSEYFYGTSWNTVGGIPTDILTYGYFQLGLPGVIITLLLLGYICGKIDKTLYLLPKNKSREFISVVIATNIYGIISSADLASLLRGNVILSSTCIILILVSKYLKNNPRVNL